ncbi:hypothetical protein J2Y70_002674 [Xanthomonas translucens]|nr:hypothetical protein [Xanthomonas translucens]
MDHGESGPGTGDRGPGKARRRDRKPGSAHPSGHCLGSRSGKTQSAPAFAVPGSRSPVPGPVLIARYAASTTHSPCRATGCCSAA